MADVRPRMSQELPPWGVFNWQNLMAPVAGVELALTVWNSPLDQGVRAREDVGGQEMKVVTPDETTLLHAWRGGSPAGREQRVPLVHEELRAVLEGQRAR